MRCSTCGETLQPGAVRCPTCGTATPVGMALTRPTGVRRCPRCSYQGEGIPYFRRAGHVGLLVGVSLFTYGFGGLIYWMARRKHLICPRCGLGWEHASRAIAAMDSAPDQRMLEAEPEEALPSSGIKRRVLGVGMVLAASLLVLIGFVEWEMAAVAVGSVMGAGGSLSFYWGWQGLQERRNALMQGLQRKILRLASMKGGTLTVTEVAADLNVALPTADKILTSMDDGFRVRSEISKEGVLYYEFPELLHRDQIGPGD
jgi:uncharacterized membrane protein YphA (DoxX/SURF4 family)/predicted RNA-binding Zn-ribbon protein involved in translation (DUF1610 family)